MRDVRTWFLSLDSPVSLYNTFPFVFIFEVSRIWQIGWVPICHLEGTYISDVASWFQKKIWLAWCLRCGQLTRISHKKSSIYIYPLASQCWKKKRLRLKMVRRCFPCTVLRLHDACYASWNECIFLGKWGQDFWQHSEPLRGPIGAALSNGPSWSLCTKKSHSEDLRKWIWPWRWVRAV